MDGSKVQFWHDLWCGEQSLKILILNYLVLKVVRMCRWRIICSFGMKIFIRIFSLQDQCMIGIFF
jgi:hypothetical protein